MMNKPIATLLTYGIILAASSSAQATALLNEKYEGGGPFQTNSGNANVGVTTTADPGPGGLHGTVAAVDLSVGAAVFGEVRANPTDNLPLAGVSPAGIPYTISFDYYVPSNTTAGAEDGMNIVLRWNDGDVADFLTENSSVVLFAAGPTDTWLTHTLSGIVPATEGDLDPITHVTPILSFRDNNPQDAAPGIAGAHLFFDNVRFTFAVPEPSSALLLGMGLIGLAVRRRSRISKARSR